MDGKLMCPRCGIEAKPSRKIPAEGWWDCVKCGRVLGEPDWDNESDLGIILEPGVDFSQGSIPKGRPDRRSGNRKGRSPSKPRKRYPSYFPLPVPPPGSKMSIRRNGTHDST